MSWGQGYTSPLTGWQTKPAPDYSQAWKVPGIKRAPAKSSGTTPGYVPPVQEVAPPPPPAPPAPIEPIKNPFLADAALSNEQARIRRDDAITEINRQRGVTQADYYGDDPTSRQNALIRAFQETRSKQGIAQAAQGQSLSGAAATASQWLGREQGFQGDILKKQYDDIMGGLGSQETAANHGYDEVVTTNDINARQAWANDPRNTPTPPPPAPDPAPAPEQPAAEAQPDLAAFIQQAVKSGDWIVTTYPQKSSDGRNGVVHVHSDGRKVWVPR